MKRQIVVRAALTMLAVASVQPPLHAQSESTPPPKWLVWRAFHDSLEFYEQESPEAVTQLLKDRIALVSFPEV